MTKFVMEKTIRVNEVMSSSLVTIPAHISVAEAAVTLQLHKISGAPVVSGSGAPIGIVSRTDLVLRQLDGPDLPVERVMTRVLYAVRSSDPVSFAAQLMIDEAIHRALVVDNDGRVVGIVTPMDILRGVFRIERHEPAANLEYVKLT